MGKEFEGKELIVIVHIPNKSQIEGGYPTQNKLPDNSISGQKYVKNKLSKAVKSKKRN